MAIVHFCKKTSLTGRKLKEALSSLNIELNWGFGHDHEGVINRYYKNASDKDTMQVLLHDLMPPINTVMVRQGRNIAPVMGTSLVNKANEYRVLCCGDKCIGIYEKVPNFAEVERELLWKQNNCNFKRLDRARADVMAKVRPIINMAIEAHKRLKLDISGSDIAIDTNDKVWIFEVNSAPGLNDNNIERVVRFLYDRVHCEEAYYES